MKRTLFLYCYLFIIVIGVAAQKTTHLVILHTNDTHSQIEPTDPTAVRNAAMGGYARRMGVINQIRSQEENVLLVDAGDLFQGTPYFNFFNGRVEIEGYNMMKYDVITLGNHEFDNGIDSLAVMLKLAKFQVVNSNYELSNTAISKLVKPYIVLKRGGVRIGIFGVGANPEGLIMERNYKGMVYNDPVASAQKMEKILKNREKCDVIICLSHLGSVPGLTVRNDYEIAEHTTDIDVIIGGHSHSMEVNAKTLNANGKNVVIQQMGKSGFYLGRVDLQLTAIK